MLQVVRLASGLPVHLTSWSVSRALFVSFSQVQYPMATHLDYNETLHMPQGNNPPICPRGVRTSRHCVAAWGRYLWIICWDISIKVGARNSPSTLRAPFSRQLAVTTNFSLQQASNLLDQHAGMFKMFCYILGKSECSFHVNIAASETVSDLRLRAAILHKNKHKLVGVQKHSCLRRFPKIKNASKIVIIPKIVKKTSFKLHFSALLMAYSK